MAWVFIGYFLDNIAADRMVAGTGELQNLPGRFALAGLVDAHSHPTVAADAQGPYLADADFAAARLAAYASSGVSVIRDVGGPQRGHARVRRSRNDRMPAGDSGRTIPRPGEQVLPPHAFARRRR
jgi:hypothetical protein